MFKCNVCDFSTDRKSNYLIHIGTKKHIENINLVEFCNIESEKDICDNENTTFTPDLAESQNFFPFENRLELMLYILRGSKYHNIDQELFKFILHILRVANEDKVLKIPPFHKIWNKKIDGLELKSAVHILPSGEELHYVKPSDVIELEFSKKNVVESLERYPRIAINGEISHQCSGEKWRKSLKSLMARNGKGDPVFIGDVVRTDNGDIEGVVDEFFIQDCQGNSSVMATVKCENLQLPVKETVEVCHLLPTEKPNEYDGDDKDRVNNLINLSKTTGLDICMVPVNIFVDDTSANRSKKWNPLTVWTMQLAGIPSKEKMRKSSHHMLGVTKPETESIALPIVQDLNNLFYEGKIIYDAKESKNIIVTSALGFGIMDNMMAVEFCHLMGPAAKEFCRFCRFLSNPMILGERRTKEQTECFLGQIGQSKATGTLYGIKSKRVATEMNKAVNWDPHS